MHNDIELRSKVKLIGSILGSVLKNNTNETVFDPQTH